jgi:hypothetical protein
MSPGARKAASADAPVRFRGPPHRLTSLVALPDGQEAASRPKALLEGAQIEGAQLRGLAVRPVTREGGPTMSKVTLRLPKSTPPGSYPGSVEVGGRQVPVVVEVEPRPKVEVSPSRLTFEVEPGAEVTAAVTLLNVGNVPFQVPAASKFCVFDGSGVDHAFWVALASDPPEGKERIDLLLDDLAESHGGLVEVRARSAKRTIAPAEASEVEVTLRFTDRLRPGRAYAGSWDADGLHLRIRVSVAAGKTKPPATEVPR